MFDLAQLQQERQLVSIRRDAIDEHELHGFVLAHSDALVAIQRIDDFRLDGLTLLRRADITAVESDDADAFRKELLGAEGTLAYVPFGLALDLHDWRSAITQWSREHDLMILECEALDDPDFLVGCVVDSDDEAVRFATFSTVAEWRETPDEIPFEDITICQVDTYYLNVYSRFFEREASAAD